MRTWGRRFGPELSSFNCQNRRGTFGLGKKKPPRIKAQSSYSQRVLPLRLESHTLLLAGGGIVISMNATKWRNSARSSSKTKSRVHRTDGLRSRPKTDRRTRMALRNHARLFHVVKFNLAAHFACEHGRAFVIENKGIGAAPR